MARSVAENSKESRISLLLLGAIAFMVIADMRVIDPLLRVIANDFGTSVGYTAAIVSAYTIPYGLFQLVYGPLGDRIGKLQVMSKAIAIFAIGTAASAIVPNLPLLIVLRFLTGMVAAAIIPLSLAYIGDHFPYSERQTAIGRYLSFLMLGQILSSSLGGIFGEYLSWREIFLVFGLASMVIAIIFAQRVTRSSYIPSAIAHTSSFWSFLQPYFRLLLQRNTRIFITTVFVEGCFLFGASAYLGAFIRDRYGLSYAIIGLLLSGFGMGGLLYSASVQWLVRRLGEHGLVLTGGGLIGFCYLCMILLQYWVLLIPEIILLGLGSYMLHSTLQTRATELCPDSRGTAVSLFAFSLFLGQGIGAAIIGYIVDHAGYIPGFILSSSVIVLLSIWFARQLRHYCLNA
jgi:predicted MFS family arabinose efflux permease